MKSQGGPGVLLGAKCGPGQDRNAPAECPITFNLLVERKGIFQAAIPLASLCVFSGPPLILVLPMEIDKAKACLLRLPAALSELLMWSYSGDIHLVKSLRILSYGVQFFFSLPGTMTDENTAHRPSARVVLAVSTAATGLAFISVCARLYTRYFVDRQLWFDDLTTVAALVRAARIP